MQDRQPVSLPPFVYAAVGFVMGMVFGVLTRLFLRYMRCAERP